MSKETANRHIRLAPAQWPYLQIGVRGSPLLRYARRVDRSSRHPFCERPLNIKSEPRIACCARVDPKTEHPMRRSRFMQNEIRQLLGEASAGVPVADICEAAGVTPRTFYRWRRQFGGLEVPAVRQMKDLVSENQRLRGLVSNLFEQLRTPADSAPGERRTLKATAPQTEERARDPIRASRIAAEKCGGALTGHFASVRVNR